jgi:hypothetical protein
MKSLKTKYSHGYYEISTELLKISAPYICSPLTYIYNKSTFSGSFPDHLKFSVTEPVYKKGSRMNPKIYRLISLLTSFLKVFEKALYITLTEHCYGNTVLEGNLFVFRKGIANEDTISKVSNEILNALNNKTIAGSIFCDLERELSTL